jgi:aminoglycoside 3-N-acetyltransferase
MSLDMNKIYTKKDIFAQLEAMGAPRGSVVLMHSSLRLIGRVEGGATALLDAMIEYFTADGGLFCVPTHTWASIKEEITLDMNENKTCLGALSDIAAADPRGIRSENPTHSMVVFGERKRALEFVKGEISVPSGTAPDSCYGRIYREGGYILLVGVGHNRNTYLHCVEEMIGTPNRLTPEPYDVSVILKSGEIVRSKLRGHYTTFTSDVSLRFPKYETAFRYYGAIRDGYVGDAPTQLCDARIMKDVMGLIMKNFGDKDPLSDEWSIPPEKFVKRGE